MTSLINVNGSDDPSYRYKMPRLISKVEGRGNGVKTVIVNASDIANALKRSTAQVTKFFGCELGAMSKYTESEDKALVNGSFDTKVLQESLTIYIEKFVLCPSCNNPETVQEIKGKKKSAVLYLDCKACGAHEEADNSHKLMSFIVKEIGTSDKKGKKSKKDKKKKKKGKKKKRDSGSESDGQENENSNATKEEDAKEVEGKLGELSIQEKESLEVGIEKTKELLKSEENDQILNQLEKIQDELNLSRLDQLTMIFLAVLSKDFVSKPSKMLQNFELIEKTMNQVSKLFLNPEEGQIELFLLFEEALSRSQDEKIMKMVPLFLKEMYERELITDKGFAIWFNSAFDKVELWKQKFVHKREPIEKPTLKRMKEEAKLFQSLLDSDSDSDTASETD
eukprot:snap_masked-scaffold_21-processed-gene-5.60-mRNA-1 protein AED:0.14 eAED:0.42 QI:0/-1/0/1/-1/1/1/0/393